MMTFDDDMLNELVDSVCLPLLGTGATRGAANEAACGGAPPLLAARVDIEGAWQGSVELACSEALLERVAVVMFGAASGAASAVPPDGTPDGAADREDVMLELANLVGGTAKAQLPGPSTLGLPEPCAPDVATSVRLEVLGEPLYVSVYGFEALAAI